VTLGEKKLFSDNIKLPKYLNKLTGMDWPAPELGPVPVGDHIAGIGPCPHGNGPFDGWYETPCWPAENSFDIIFFS
jgi:hypothetical protein